MIKEPVSKRNDVFRYLCYGITYIYEANIIDLQ